MAKSELKNWNMHEMRQYVEGEMGYEMAGMALGKPLREFRKRITPGIPKHMRPRLPHNCGEDREKLWMLTCLIRDHRPTPAEMAGRINGQAADNPDTIKLAKRLPAKFGAWKKKTAGRYGKNPPRF